MAAVPTPNSIAELVPSVFCPLFSRSESTVDPITINDKQIEVVSSAKLLEAVVSRQRQAERACRIYMQKRCDAPVLLKTAKARKLPTQGYATFLHDMYTSCIILEYACSVFHNALPQYLSNEMGELQKRALDNHCLS